MDNPPVAHILEELGISFRLLAHRKPAHNIEEAAKERNMRPEQLAKCMLCSNSKDEILCFVVPGNRTLDFKKARKAAGERRMKFIPRETIENSLHLTIGAIAPVQLLGQARFFLDEQFGQESEIAISGGNLGTGVALTPQTLIKLLEPMITDISIPISHIP